jgi:hypothetical protein
VKASYIPPIGTGGFGLARTKRPADGGVRPDMSACRFAGDIQMPVTLFHNPKCSTSRNALTLLREKGSSRRWSNI